MTKSSFYDELDALLQFDCEICRIAEIGCTLSRMRALPPKLGGQRCIFILLRVLQTATETSHGRMRSHTAIPHADEMKINCESRHNRPSEVQLQFETGSSWLSLSSLVSGLSWIEESDVTRSTNCVSCGSRQGHFEVIWFRRKLHSLEDDTRTRGSRLFFQPQLRK